MSEKKVSLGTVICLIIIFVLIMCLAGMWYYYTHIKDVDNGIKNNEIELDNNDLNDENVVQNDEEKEEDDEVDDELDEKIAGFIIENYLDLWGRKSADYRMFLEELIKQHKKINLLCPTSVNTLRIMTFVNNNRSEILYAALRVGNGIYEVDNFHKGGMGVSIDTKTGKLKGNAIDKDLKEFKRHPATKTIFNNFELPYWKETKKLVRDAALINQNIKVVGWDVAITKEGPVLVEGNRRPGFDLVQVLSKRGRKDIIYYVNNNLNK